MFTNFNSVMTNVQKQEIEMVLTRRDKIMNVGNSVINQSITMFKLTAPRDTGNLSNSVKKGKSGRNTLMLQVPRGNGGRGNLVNILNSSKTRNRRSAGFFDRIEYETRNRFMLKASRVK